MSLYEENPVCLIVAMKEEAELIIKHYKMQHICIQGFSCYISKKANILVTGVGLINAAIGTYIAISVLNCKKIINYGVAGYTGNEYCQGALFSVNKVYNRDVNFTSLGYAPYTFPGQLAYINLNTDNRLPVIECYSSNEFVGEKSEVPKQVLVDMESYSVAYVCKHFNVSCMVYKSISDNTQQGESQEQLELHLEQAICNISNYIIHNVL